MNQFQNRWRSGHYSPRLSRRRLLKGMLGAGAAVPLASFLAACGGGSDEEPAADAATTAGVSNPTATGETQTATTATSAPTSEAGAEGVQKSLTPDTSGTEDGERAAWTKPDYDRVDHLLEILERTEEDVLVRDQYDQEVEVPADPQRVIADWDPIADLLLALDIKPAALFTFSNPDFSAVLLPMLDGVENIPALGGPNYEAVLAVQPDLIIDALTRDRAVYDRLSEIAPTMSVGLLGITHWRTALRDIAAIFGRSTRAEEVLAEYEQRLTEARDKLRGAGIYGETVACIRAREKQYSLYSVGALEADDAFYPTNLTALIYDDLALVPPQMVQDIPREEIAVEMSLEVLPDLGADHLFIRRENEESFQELMNHPLMETIPAVQKGNVHVHSDDEWTTGGPILNSAWLDIIVTDLLGKSE